MKYTVRPISDRTPFGGGHETSKFKVNWSQALDLLDRELWNLDAENVVIEVDVPESGIRNDGQLRANARAASPAVRVAFDSNQGPLVYATDRFVPGWGSRMLNWQHNVYAIALGLEALRKIDRYGITRRGEQYTGWKAIEATPAGMGRDAALAVITRWSRWHNPVTADESAVSIRAHVRRARANAHPDRNGGDRTAWDQVEQAAKVLGVLS
jgi:hypothetical protein